MCCFIKFTNNNNNNKFIPPSPEISSCAPSISVNKHLLQFNVLRRLFHWSSKTEDKKRTIDPRWAKLIRTWHREQIFQTKWFPWVSWLWRRVGSRAARHWLLVIWKMLYPRISKWYMHRGTQQPKVRPSPKPSHNFLVRLLDPRSSLFPKVSCSLCTTRNAMLCYLSWDPWT